MANPLAAVGVQVVTAVGAGSAGVVAAPIVLSASYALNERSPVQIPDAGTLIQAYRQGWLKEDEVRPALAKHSIAVSNLDDLAGMYKFNDANTLTVDWTSWQRGGMLWSKALQTTLYLPTPDEVLLMLNRKLITSELANHWMLRNNGDNPELARQMIKLQYEIPGPSDLIRFAVREAYNPELLRLYGYARETPNQVKPWMEKQGYGQDIGIPYPDNATDGDGTPLRGNASWFDLYWWSHWELPSLTQGYEMLHRLYPSSTHGPSPDIVNNASFSSADLDLLQKAQDIPDYWRTRLQSISYHPINRTDADWLYKNDIIDDNGYYHAMRQGGYTDSVAETLLRAAKLKRERDLGIDPGKVTKDWICQHYKTGIITDQRAKDLLEQNGFGVGEVDQFLNNCQLDIRAETQTVMINHLEKAYYNGIFSDFEVQQQFILMNTNEFVANQLFQRWQLRRGVKIRLVSARQNLTYFKEGMINEQVLQTRLFNLGYEANSVTLMVANAKREVMVRTNLQLLKQAKALAMQQKAAAKAALANQKKTLDQQKKSQQVVTNLAKKRLRGFIRASSDKNIVEWYGKKLIELWEAYYRLYYKDYTIKDAEHWVVNKLTGPTDKERANATQKAQTQYRSEGNPPLI